MSESSDSAAQGAASQNGSQPVAPIQFAGQYIKDLSFEVPHAPEIYDDLRQAPPDIPITIDVAVRDLDQPSTYEVTLSLHLEATVKGKTAFILELAYGCVVILGELPEAHVRPVLMIEVPRQMYPFARQIVADTTVKGGFPPLMLQLVNFMELYTRRYATEEELKQAQTLAEATRQDATAQPAPE